MTDTNVTLGSLEINEDDIPGIHPKISNKVNNNVANIGIVSQKYGHGKFHNSKQISGVLPKEIKVEVFPSLEPLTTE